MPSEPLKEDLIDNNNVVEMTSTIVASYVSHNPVQPVDLPVIIRSIHDTLLDLSKAGEEAQALVPAVSVKKSITDDYIICLEDGEKFKSLRRHLRSKYDMSPEDYREKWGLPTDYPMVAPSYARQRSALAKKMGLGQNRKSSK